MSCRIHEDADAGCASQLTVRVDIIISRTLNLDLIHRFLASINVLSVDVPTLNRTSIFTSGKHAMDVQFVSIYSVQNCESLVDLHRLLQRGYSLSADV